MSGHESGHASDHLAGPCLRGVLLSLVVAGFAGCTSEVEGASPAVSATGGADAVTASVPAADPPAEIGIVEASASAVPAPPAVSAMLLLPADAADKAPETYRVRFTTTKGDIVIEVTRAWAPRGADRFYTLAKHGFFSDMAFFRVMPHFMAQFGMHFDKRVRDAWRNQKIPDDPVTQSNLRGTISFASSGPNSRTTQLFINRADNINLDTHAQGFPPIGRVVEGMAVVDQIYDRYGDAPSREAPTARGPQQPRIDVEGNEYLRVLFPKLDYIRSAAIEE